MSMDEKIIANVFDLFITTKCTMNCKKCCAYIPFVQNSRHTPKEIVFREIKEFFHVFDYANRIEFIGGEPMMHPELTAIVEESVKYKEQYGFMRITTNCTIVPNDDFLRYIHDCGVYFDFVLDDYGVHSRAYPAVAEKLDAFGIPYKVYHYHGDEQYFNGWIDFGDHSDKNYTEQELIHVFSHCTAAVKNTFFATYDGKVHPCLYSLAGQYTGRLAPKPGEWIDLFDDAMTYEKKREIANNFLKAPFNACRYCNGFLSDSAERIQAAVQL